MSEAKRNPGTLRVGFFVAEGDEYGRTSYSSPTATLHVFVPYPGFHRKAAPPWALIYVAVGDLVVQIFVEHDLKLLYEISCCLFSLLGHVGGVLEPDPAYIGIDVSERIFIS